MPRVCPVCSSVAGDDTDRCAADGAILIEERPRGAMAGTVLGGRYALGPRVGGGALGDVHRAVDQTMGRSVAVKVLHPELSADPETLDRYFAQARMISRLKHPQTVSVHDFGKTPQGQGFIVMDLVDGEDLRRKLERDGRIPPQRALAIARQIADSLAEAHGQGVVHGCLRPEHVLLRDAFGRIDVVTVIDYGLTQAAQWDATEVGGGLTYGYPGYTSPEVVAGDDPGPRSDLYGLGVVLWEMMTGAHPLAAANVPGQVQRVLYEEIPNLTDAAPRLKAPPGTDTLLHRLTALDPGERFESAIEVVTAIDEAQEASELDSTTVFVLNPAAAAPAVMHPTPRGEAEAARPGGSAKSAARINQRATTPSSVVASSSPGARIAEHAPVRIEDPPRERGRGLLVVMLFLLTVIAGIGVAVLIEPTLLDRFMPGPKVPESGAPPVGPAPSAAPVPGSAAGAPGAPTPAAPTAAPARSPEERTSLLREPTMELERRDRNDLVLEAAPPKPERKPTPRGLQPR